MHKIFIISLFLALSVTSVTAEELTSLNRGVNLDQGGGMMVNIPASGEQALLNRLAIYHADLHKQRSNYVVQLEKTKFDVKDVLIMVIMPGGLIYAAARKQQHSQVKANLQLISDQLAELKADMHQLAQESSMQSVAMLN